MIHAKHQVFISSTYSDLIQERQSLFQATYRLGHIPIGMEGFVAANLSQWKYIEKRITESDYFILVLANKYGTIIPDGSERSYTEAEYDLATKLEKPILRFILNPSAKWKTEHRDKEARLAKKLELLKKQLAKDRLLAYWDDSASLEAIYTQSLTSLIRDEPRGGLYPTGQHPDYQSLGINSLNNQPNSTSHGDLLSDPKPVTIIMNDGYNYVPKYEKYLRFRAENGHRTKIILCDPDSDFIHSISMKSNKYVEQQRRDIEISVRRLKEIGGSSNKSFEVRGHLHVNCYDGCINENAAILSFYPTRIRSSRRLTLKLYKHDNGLHETYYEDIEQLWREAESIDGSDLIARHEKSVQPR
jgi:hypothetical protein